MRNETTHMRRKMLDTLQKWKREGAGESALLIDGARRVGKSFIVEEFLWANGLDALMPSIREMYATRRSMGALHRTAMDAFRAYMLVGGMPQAVKNTF